MPWGNQQATYTDMRSSFGDYGGIMATGMMGDYGAGYAPQGPGRGYDDGGVSAFGMEARPVSYLPPPRVMIPQGGMYVSQMPLSQTLGYATGFNDAPRNISPYEMQLRAAQSFGRGAGAGIATAGVSAAGIAGGMLSTGIGAGIGSIVGAGAGMLLGGPGGALVGAKIGGFVGSIAPSVMASGVTGGISDLVGQKQDIANYLDAASFRFVGAGSSMADPRSKAGMGMRARREVAETMTEMDIKDKFLNMEDLTRILKAGSEQGIFTGSRDIEDFKKKFKNLAENVKEVAKTFNTTIEESVKVMRDMRGMGMDTSQTFKMITQADALGRVAGRTAAEMFSLGQQGAEMYRGTGVSMQIGFQQTQANLATVRAQRDAGILSQEAIAQAGGEEALAMRMNVGALSFSQTGLGRGMMMSMVKSGQLDTGAMSRFLQGRQTLAESATAAGANISSPADLIRFQAHQAANLSALGKEYGGQGLQFLKMASISQMADLQVQAMPGLKAEDAFRSIALQQGNTESEVDVMVGMMKNREKDAQAKMQAAEATRRKQHYDTINSNFFFTRMKDKISDQVTRAQNVVAEPVNEFIEGAGEYWKGFVEKKIYGAESWDVSGSYKSVRQSMRNEIAAGGDLANPSLANTPIDLRSVGWGTGSAGTRLAKREDSLAANFGVSLTQDESRMAVILDESSNVIQGTAMGGLAGSTIAPVIGTAVGAAVGGAASTLLPTVKTGLTRESYAQLEGKTNVLRRGLRDKVTIEQALANDKDADAIKLKEGASVSVYNNRNRILGAKSGVDALQIAAGKDISKITDPKEFIAYRNEIESLGGPAKEMMDNLDTDLRAVDAAVNDTKSKSIVNATEERAKIVEEVMAAGTGDVGGWVATGMGVLGSVGDTVTFGAAKELSGWLSDLFPELGPAMSFEEALYQEGRNTFGSVSYSKEEQENVMGYLGATGPLEKSRAYNKALKALTKTGRLSEEDARKKLDWLDTQDALKAKVQKSQANVGGVLLRQGVSELQDKFKEAGLETVGSALNANALDTESLMAADTDKLSSVSPRLADTVLVMKDIKKSVEDKTLESDLAKKDFSGRLVALGFDKDDTEGILKDVKEGKTEVALKDIQTQGLITQQRGGVTNTSDKEGASKAGTPDEAFTQSANAIYLAAQVLDGLARKVGVR